MDIREFTRRDLEHVSRMACEFLEESQFLKYADGDALGNFLGGFLVDDPNKVGFVTDHGMILGILSPFPYGKCLVATECGWYVDPNYRGSGEGIELLKAFESWAENKGAKLITMISINDKLDKFYERNGYSIGERTFMKEI